MGHLNSGVLQLQFRETHVPDWKKPVFHTVMTKYPLSTSQGMIQTDSAVTAPNSQLGVEAEPLAQGPPEECHQCTWWTSSSISRCKDSSTMPADRWARCGKQ
ncbi:TPA: hypothetical protein ACH3X1_012326 [Trebouxia sp. C0004]